MKSSSNANKANLFAKLAKLLISSDKVSGVWKVVILAILTGVAYAGGYLDGLIFLLLSQ